MNPNAIQSLRSITSNNNASNQLCQRCKTREAVFCCNKCEMFQLFCRFCDTYVHGLPSKKGHSRFTLEKMNSELAKTNNNCITEISNKNETISKINKIKSSLDNSSSKMNKENIKRNMSLGNLKVNKNPNINLSSNNPLNTHYTQKSSKKEYNYKSNTPSFNNRNIENKKQKYINKTSSINNNQYTYDNDDYVEDNLSNLNQHEQNDQAELNNSNYQEYNSNNDSNINRSCNEDINSYINYNNNTYSGYKPKILSKEPYSSNSILETYNNTSKSRIYNNLKQATDTNFNNSAYKNLDNNNDYINTTNTEIQYGGLSMQDQFTNNSINKRDLNNLMEYYLKNNSEHQVQQTTLPQTSNTQSNENKLQTVNTNINSNSNNNIQSEDNLKTQENDTNTKSFSVIPNIHNTYSREYVNELRSIFLREKNELIFKNNTMQNTLDKLKNSFSEQIAQMTGQIEETNRKHHYSLQALEENIDSYYKTIILEKETQIEDQNCKIKSLLDSNKYLTEKLNNTNIMIDDLSSKKSISEEYFKKIIKEKDELLNQISRDIKFKEEQNEKSFHNQGQGISQEYENKINSILKDFEEVKNKLNHEILIKDDELNALKKNFSDRESELLIKISGLEEEVNCHKQNIVCYRDRRIELENEIKNYKELLENAKREIKMKVNEIKIIENNNFGLMKENDELKIQLSKLDKLVYGKVKQPQRYKN